MTIDLAFQNPSIFWDHLLPLWWNAIVYSHIFQKGKPIHPPEIGPVNLPRIHVYPLFSFFFLAMVPGVPGWGLNMSKSSRKWRICLLDLVLPRIIRILVMVRKSGYHQLIPVFYRVLYIPGGCSGFLPSTIGNQEATTRFHSSTSLLDVDGFLGGGFKKKNVSPRYLGKSSNLTSIFFKWVETTWNHHLVRNEEHRKIFLKGHGE